MGYRSVDFVPGHIYHVCHRGINQVDIFNSDHDRSRFLKILVYSNAPENKLSYSIAAKVKRRDKEWPVMSKKGAGYTDLICYCLMSNHVHLLLKENIEHGISTHMQRTFNGYAKYYNALYRRTGGLFAGRFRAVIIDGDEQFLHVSRYIHLNPYTAGIIENPEEYKWSSLIEYLGRRQVICQTNLLKSIMKPSNYREFMCDYASYARELASIKHLLVED